MCEKNEEHFFHSCLFFSFTRRSSLEIYLFTGSFHMRCYEVIRIINNCQRKLNLTKR